MRAYFRVAPRFGVSMPLWLAFIAYSFWIALAVAFWAYYAVFWVLRFLVLAGVAMWRRRHP